MSNQLSKRITGTKLQQHHERYIHHPTRLASRTMTYRYWYDGMPYQQWDMLRIFIEGSRVHEWLFATRNTCEGD